ncbi:hypothetical protein C1T30_43370, partial [Bacillus sp. MBGLi97]
NPGACGAEPQGGIAGGGAVCGAGCGGEESPDVDWIVFGVFQVVRMKYVVLAMLALAVQSCERTPSTRTSQPMKTELWWSYLAD